MPTFAVSYGYHEDSEEARNEHRPAHVDFLRGLHASGLLYMSGPLVGETPRALLIFEALDAPTLTAHLDDDPFSIHGLIAQRTITAWNVFFDPRVGAAR